MSYRQGDIIEAAFPFSDKGGTKKRPCVIISNENAKGNHYNEFLVLAISKSNNEDGFALPVDNDRLSVPLPKKCYFRVMKIQAIQEVDFERKISAVNTDYLKEIVSQVTALFEVQ